MRIIGRYDLVDKDGAFFQYMYVCSDHFVPEMYVNPLKRNSSRLSACAVPSSNILSKIAHIQEADTVSQRNEQSGASLCINSSSNVCSFVKPTLATTSFATGLTLQSENTKLKDSISTVNQLKLVVRHVMKSNQGTQTRKFRIQDDLKKSLQKQRKFNSKLRIQNLMYKKKLQEIKKSSKLDFINNFEHLTDFEKLFFTSIAKARMCKQRGMKWSSDLIHFALQIFFQSTASYKTLGTYFNLPSISTLKRHLKPYAQKAGIIDFMFDTLAQKAKNFSDRERFCNITFDAMTIAEALSYSADKDEIVGYVDYGDSCKNNIIANQVVVFMARALVANWKQPLCCFLCKNNLSVEQLKMTLFSIIDKLEQAGLWVKAIICDQEPKHQKLFQILSDGNYYFEHPISKNKICLIFDPPHLLKNTRTCLKKYWIQVSVIELFIVIIQFY